MSTSSNTEVGRVLRAGECLLSPPVFQKLQLRVGDPVAVRCASCVGTYLCRARPVQDGGAISLSADLLIPLGRLLSIGQEGWEDGWYFAEDVETTVLLANGELAEECVWTGCASKHSSVYIIGWREIQHREEKLSSLVTASSPSSCAGEIVIASKAEVKVSFTSPKEWSLKTCHAEHCEDVSEIISDFLLHLHCFIEGTMVRLDLPCTPNIRVVVTIKELEGRSCSQANMKAKKKKKRSHAKISSQHYPPGVVHIIDDATTISVSSHNDMIVGRKSLKALEYKDESSQITWERVDITSLLHPPIGLERELMSLVDMVMLPRTHTSALAYMNIDPPRGALITGPSGVGKSLLIRTVAAHTRAALFTITPRDLMSAYIGDSEESLRRIFEAAYSAVESGMYVSHSFSHWTNCLGTARDLFSSLLSSLFSLLSSHLL